MILPPFLKQGDTIAIVATARFITEDVLFPVIQEIKSWGFEVYIHDELYVQCNQFAGSDLHRAKVLQSLIDDDNVKAIICARGGYGTTRMIDLIDFSKFVKKPKWIAGFSDVTALNARLFHLGIASLHGIMPILFFNENAQKSVESLKKTLFGQIDIIFTDTNELNSIGTVKAPLIGGNLSMITHLIGSVDDLNTEGKILFIEDLDEYLYHIDRMMVQLKRAGKLQHLAGMIVGHMSDMKDNTIPFGKNALEIIAEHVSEYSYPVCFSFPVGHVFDNFTLINGAEYHLTVSESQVSLSL